MKASRPVQTRELPSPASFGPGAVLLHDRRLSTLVPGFRAWSHGFKARLGLTAGEGLKSIDALPGFIRKLTGLTRGYSRREARLVCVGGGSIGDFGGFAASILKRGIGLVHVPSTWLAAVDSAHGGKTALNVGGAKNQIGTFYPADRTLLVKSLLFTGPARRAREGLSELLKVALLDGGPWTHRLFKDRKEDADLIWKYLQAAIMAKWRVVVEDPEERTGHRQILNLGHTLGHVLEAHHGISHGRAVAQGLFFALDWSRRSGRLKKSDHASFLEILSSRTGEESLVRTLGGISRKKFLSLLSQDKKSGSGSEVTFIFLRGLGHPVRTRVSLEEVADEARRQGWVQ